MEYTIRYDVGDRKRDGGINEDSVAFSVFEQGHRAGLTAEPRSRSENDPGNAETRPQNRNTAVFALADGAGGHDAGDVASYLATTVVCDHLAPIAIETGRREPDAFDISLHGANEGSSEGGSNDDRTDEVLSPDRPSVAERQAAVEDAIVAAHREIVRYAARTGTQAYTTIVAGLVVDGECHYGWVGDSRAYVLNTVHDSIERLTKDHGVVQELHDCEAIDDVAAHVHPRGNEITRALGGTGDADPDTASVAVDTNTVPLFAEDLLLVTSDGLIDAQTDAPALYEQYIQSGRTDEVAESVRDAVVTDDEIRDVVLSAESLDDAGTDLIDLGNDRGGKDNLSAVLAGDFAFQPSPTASADFPTRAIDPDDSVEDRETLLLPDK